MDIFKRLSDRNKGIPYIEDPDVEIIDVYFRDYPTLSVGDINSTILETHHILEWLDIDSETHIRPDGRRYFVKKKEEIK
jgi:desulfoferrodoxin (superoxide reductase-like protein)